jgi:predicted transposase YbfD/YdcC
MYGALSTNILVCEKKNGYSRIVLGNKMCFAQVKSEGKGKELDAVEQLIQFLDLKGALVTTDALACNLNIAGLLQQAHADYLLQIKEHQPTLLAQTATLFNEALLEGFQGFTSDQAQSVDGDHGRVETRQLYVLWDVQHLGAIGRQWIAAGLQCVVMVVSTRESDTKKSVERRYYAGSLNRRHKAATILQHTRGHWGVENNLHWHLDVSFAEDDRRIRMGHGAENFSRLCRISLTLLKNETTRKVGIAIKRQICGWDNDYLLKVLAG